MLPRPAPFLKLLPLRLALLPAGCVCVDPGTGETLPRGDQKHRFETEERRADALRPGMTKFDARVLLGSPANKSADENTRGYLPERPAVLMPSRALRLVFENGVLVKHSRPVIFLGLGP